MANLKAGDRVVILKHASYRDKFLGETGTVCVTYQSTNSIGVKLDNYRNSYSKYDCYWFKSTHLKVIKTNDITEEYDIMNITMNMKKGEDYTVAEIKFLDENGGRTYKYLLFDADVRPDDLVVVKTGHHGFALAQVIDLDNETDGSEIEHNRQIVCKVDLTAYENRIAMSKKMAELKKQMDAKVKQLQNLALYEMLAQQDPELKAMLDEYKLIAK